MINQIGPLTTSVIDACINEFRKEENRTKLNDNILDPIVDHILGKIQPYILVTSCTFVVIIILSIVIIYLIITSDKDI